MIAVERLDNDLAGWIDRVLVASGAIPASAFEATFVAMVQATAADPLDAWEAFYRNTLDRLRDDRGEPGGTIAEFAPVHEHAARLVRGTDVVELGCCFGFLALRLAADGAAVTAVDVSAPTLALLQAMAARLGVGVRVVAGDAVAPPLADGCADTVLAVHLLEHLSPEAGAAALRHMQRLARRRVVVAVPFEQTPNPTWGHVRTFDLPTLAELGRASGWRHEVAEQHGGWLVLDR